MTIKDKIWQLINKYDEMYDLNKRFDKVILGANTAGNRGVDPDDALGYADFSSSAEVLIVLSELLEFINKSEKE
jgi:hypothetical protein